MSRLTLVGRIFFALALIALGADHFIFGEFVTGRAPPWPASVPGGAAWAYLTGAVLIAAGIAIITGKHARFAALLVGALIFVWAFLRHIPLVAADSILGPTWTNAARGLKMFGGAWAVAATLPPVPGGETALRRLMNGRHAFIILGRIGLASHMIVAGVLHLRFTESVATLIPDWFPGDAVVWTWLAGIALIAGGIGINVPRTARLAALLSGLMIFSWVWLIHVARELAGVGDGISVFAAVASAGIGFLLAGYAGEARRARPEGRVTPGDARAPARMTSGGDR